ncbi:unnamed protein product [Schistosoma turkestanicum]|nr:unnamed protein product [Schistosoma turkestanicum]
MNNLKLDIKSPRERLLEEIRKRRPIEPDSDVESINVSQNNPVAQQQNKSHSLWKYILISISVIICVVCFFLITGIIVYMSSWSKSTTTTTPILNFTSLNSSVGYWVDVFAFKDSDGDTIGDLNGLSSEVDYIKSVIRSGFVILSPITKGFYTNSHNMIGLVEDYVKLDEAIGSMNNFQHLLKIFHEKDLRVILTFDFNSISIDHKWIKENRVKLQMFKDGADHKISRYGKPLNVDIQGQLYYSVFGPPTVDLNLTDHQTQKVIFDVIRYWIGIGIDGILLDNAAYFIEQGKSNKGQKKQQFSCPQREEMYTHGNVEFVRRIKHEINKSMKSTGREILLGVYAGNTWCDLTGRPDPMLMFRNVADFIIIREFLPNRGCKETFPPSKKLTCKYQSYPNAVKNKLGLTVSTTSFPPMKDVLTLAASLLLPGIPIIYYGTELGMTSLVRRRRPEHLYPKGKTYLNDDSSDYDAILSHQPMPWDKTGKRFSKAIKDASFKDYTDKFIKSELVENVTRKQSERTVYALVQKLMDLRQLPTFKWGTMEELNTFNDISN